MAESTPNGVTITNADIYAELQRIKEALASLSPQAGQIMDHEIRIRSVERWKYALPTSITTSILAIVTALLDGHHG